MPCFLVRDAKNNLDGTDRATLANPGYWFWCETQDNKVKLCYGKEINDLVGNRYTTCGV